MRGRTPQGDLDRAADEAQPPLDRKIIGRQQPRRRHRAAVIAGEPNGPGSCSGSRLRIAAAAVSNATQRRVVIRLGGGAKFEIGTVDLGRALRIAAAAVGVIALDHPPIRLLDRCAARARCKAEGLECRRVRASSSFSQGDADATARSSTRKARRMARVTGLEPATSGVTGRRSNQLSYTRALAWPGN